MVPFQAMLTPLFLEMNTMQLTDSLIGLALFYTTFNLPFGVFVMRNTSPRSRSRLEDSAYVDGCGTLRTLVYVLRPLVFPASRPLCSTRSSPPGPTSSARSPSSPVTIG